MILPEKQTELLRTMIRIRAFEERVRDLFAAGRLPGFVHLSIGQEAAAAGACGALRADDYVLSTHRGHGHMVAKGADTARMMAELYAKRVGSCKGKGGSMHIADATVGVLGANGVVAGGLTIAAGVGLSIKQRRSGQLCLCFFGDGAANRGPFHEALNLAVIWRLPVLFLCENNGWASSTPHQYASAVPDVAQRAAAYGLQGQVVDGMDVLAVHQAAQDAAEAARAGRGPALIEAKVVRWQGHYEGDPQGYRDRTEITDGKARDPIERLRSKLVWEGSLRSEQVAELQQAAQDEMDRAVAFAESSPLPAPGEALDDLYARSVERSEELAGGSWQQAVS
jgi:pyruvate dehydrogenase E1 component alpha subunit